MGTYPAIPSITPAYRSLLRIWPLQHPIVNMPPILLFGRIAVPVVHSPSLGAERSGPPCLSRAATTRDLSRSAGGMACAPAVGPAEGRGVLSAQAVPSRQAVPPGQARRPCRRNPRGRAGMSMMPIDRRAPTSNAPEVHRRTLPKHGTLGPANAAQESRADGPRPSRALHRAAPPAAPGRKPLSSRGGGWE